MKAIFIGGEEGIAVKALEYSGQDELLTRFHLKGDAVDLAAADDVDGLHLILEPILYRAAVAYKMNLTISL